MLTPHMREYLSAAAISFRLDPAGTAIITVHAPGPRAEVLGGIAADKATLDSGMYPGGGDPCGEAIFALEGDEGFGLGEPWAVHRVGFTEQGQHLRGTGVGTALYRALLMVLAFHPRHSSRHGALVVPDKCGAGNPTSDEAARVWLKLAREVPSKLWTDNAGRELSVLFLPVTTAYTYAQAAGLLDEKGMRCPKDMEARLGGLDVKPWMVAHLCIDHGAKLQPWAPALAYMAPLGKKKNPMTAQLKRGLLR